MIWYGQFKQAGEITAKVALRLPKDVEGQKIVTKSGIKWYREGLKKMLDADAGPSTAKVKLIEKESDEQMSVG